MSAPRSGAILLVEDTRSLSALYEALLVKAGHEVTCAFTAAEAARAFRAHRHRIVLLDLMLPDGNGLDLLREMRESSPESRVVVITADGSINRAVEAMRSGAFDFLVKPFDERRLIGAVTNAAAAMNSGESQAELRQAPEAGAFHGFIGSSPAIRQIYDMVGSIGRSTATVFITGESGTGKEVCAQAIHSVSVRKNNPFIAINCGAIPRDLLESQVFGHLKGSFTGAIADKRGAAAAADGGTLFLDEICEMDLALQTKLLRFLQSSMIQPVGASEPHKVDVRIICASNRDPAAEVRAGRFREDLFYRLHVVPIHLPPLRDRGEDVVEIGEVLLRRFSDEEGRRFRRLHPAVREIFRRHDWPGNVRELQNVLRNVVVLHDGEEVLPEMLPADFGIAPIPHTGWPYPVRSAAQQPMMQGGGYGGIAGGYSNGGAQPHGPGNGRVQQGMAGGARGGAVSVESSDPISQVVGLTLADLERRFIERTIEECGGSIPRAARMLDVSPSTIYRKRDAWARTDT